MELMDLLLERNLQQTKEIVITGELAEHKFVIRALNSQEWNNNRKQCMNITKNSVDLDQGKLNALNVLAACVVPNFRDAGFISRAGVTLPIDLVYKVLKPGEIEKLANAILEYSGFGAELEEIPKK